jgi:type III restriction enzyme
MNIWVIAGDQAATFHLENLAKQGIAFCYARNDRLEFSIPYELCGNPQIYEPDFIVRLRSSARNQRQVT